LTVSSTICDCWLVIFKGSDN